MTSGLEEDSKILEEALTNIMEVWNKNIFGQLQEIDMEKPLTEKILEDPTH